MTLRHRPSGGAASARPRCPPTRSADLDRLRPALRQLVEGIHALHSAGKLHRDIKPSNVLVTPEGRVVLLDFGVATELRGRVGEARRERRGGGHRALHGARASRRRAADSRPPTGTASASCSTRRSSGARRSWALPVDVLTMKSIMDPRRALRVRRGACRRTSMRSARAPCSRDPAARPDGRRDPAGASGVTRSSAPRLRSQLVEPTSAAFVGREAHLDALRAAFEASQAGRLGDGARRRRLGDGQVDARAPFPRRARERRPGAIVFRGRAYEREAVPYKAVDSVIDALSRHLMHVDGGRSTSAAPSRHLAAGAPLPRAAARSGDRSTEPSGGRRSAGRPATRVRRAARAPRVARRDGSRWCSSSTTRNGATSTARRCLLDLLRPPEAPPLLLLMTYRDNEEQTSPFLKELRERWPEGADVRDLKVEPLQEDDARLLAMTLLGARDDLRETHRQRRRARIARHPVSDRGARQEQPGRRVDVRYDARRPYARSDDRGPAGATARARTAFRRDRRRRRPTAARLGPGRRRGGTGFGKRDRRAPERAAVPSHRLPRRARRRRDRRTIASARRSSPSLPRRRCAPTTGASLGRSRTHPERTPRRWRSTGSAPATTSAPRASPRAPPNRRPRSSRSNRRPASSGSRSSTCRRDRRTSPVFGRASPRRSGLPDAGRRRHARTSPQRRERRRPSASSSSARPPSSCSSAGASTRARRSCTGCSRRSG